MLNLNDAQHRPEVPESPGRFRLRFRLRTLLLLVGGFCILLAAFKVVSGWSMMLGLLALSCIAAHVFGNSLGTHLRNQTDVERRTSPRAEGSNPGNPTSIQCAPTTGLSVRKSLGIVVKIIVVLGAAAGGSLGARLLSWELHDKATVANMTLGIVASGVLGGFFGFAISTFTKVVIGANLEAWRDPRQSAGHRDETWDAAAKQVMPQGDNSHHSIVD